MTTTDRTDTPLERRRGVAAVHDRDLPLRLDAQLRPTLDTSDDPTGAAFAWPLMMLLVYAAAGLGFVLAR